MAFNFSLPYGKERLTFNCLRSPDIFALGEQTSSIDPDAFAHRLSAYLSEADLDLRRPAVVVADKTRLCGYPQYLPVLLDSLVVGGALAENITLYIAYGTHGRQSDAESRRAYGDLYDKYYWVHHTCDDREIFVDLGDTRQGTPVRLRADIAKASCVITFGAVSHHYFAGYGGGRKLIFPGLGEKNAIYANHGLLLDPQRRCLSPGCRSGMLDGNPLAEDLAEVESFRPADMAIHGIIDSSGKVCDLLVGRGRDFFQTACVRHADHCEVETSRPYDLVVASCGGFPKDINFIQSHKAIHHAADFVRDGGRLIVLAQCSDGIGSQTFLPWFEMGSWDKAFDRLAADYVGNGGTALAMMAKLHRIYISLVTSLDRSVAELIGFDRVSADQVQGYMDKCTGSLAVIPNASMLVKKAVFEKA